MESPESMSTFDAGDRAVAGHAQPGAEPLVYTSSDVNEPIVLRRPGVTVAVPRFRSHADEIDALIGRTVPDAETRKAQMSVDLGLFGFAFGRDALDEVYRNASAWMEREQAS